MINHDEFYKSFAPKKCPSCGSTHIEYKYQSILDNNKSSQQFFCNDCGNIFHVFADYGKWLDSETGKGLTPFTSSGNISVVDGCGSGSYSPRDSESKPKSWIKNAIETGLPEGEKEATGHDGSLNPTRSRKERLSPNSGQPGSELKKKYDLITEVNMDQTEKIEGLQSQLKDWIELHERTVGCPVSDCSVSHECNQNCWEVWECLKSYSRRNEKTVKLLKGFKKNYMVLEVDKIIECLEEGD